MARAYIRCIYALNAEKEARKIQRTEVRETSHPDEIPEEEFLENYKISRDMIEYLCEELGPDPQPKNSTGFDLQ